MLEHLDDIASDMSAFHRVDDVTTLSGPTFFRLAWRLPAYEGVMRARAMAAQQAEERSGSTSYEAPAASRPRQVNPGTKATLQGEPAFNGIFSFGSF